MGGCLRFRPRERLRRGFLVVLLFDSSCTVTVVAVEGSTHCGFDMLTVVIRRVRVDKVARVIASVALVRKSVALQTCSIGC